MQWSLFGTAVPRPDHPLSSPHAEHAGRVLLDLLGHMIRNRTGNAGAKIVQEQDAPRKIGIIPRLVLHGIIENQAPAFLPGPGFGGDA